MNLLRQRLPDFLQPVSGPGAWAWIWCVTGLAVLAAAGLDAMYAHEQRRQAQLALSRLTDRHVPRAAGTPAMAPGVAQGNAQASATATAQAWQAWHKRLVYPWPQVFLAAEAAAADGVAWLSLAHAPGQELQLEGEASSSAVAMATVAQLQRWVAGDGSVWHEASLQRLERLARSSPGQRLTISLQGAGDAVPFSTSGRQQP